MLTWEELEGSYPHYPKIHELKVTEEDMDSLMDIAAYVQIGPHTINGKDMPHTRVQYHSITVHWSA